MAAASYCCDCGAELCGSAADSSGRSCVRCGALHMDHPSVMLTCFVSCGHKLLWMQRKLQPKSGFWAIPGGFMEGGETTAQGAAREVWEETGVRLEPDALQFYMTGTITFINQVYIAYRAGVDSEDCRPGLEALSAQFFSRQECPWEELAYPEVNDSIRCAYDDLERGQFGCYHAQLSAADYCFEPIVSGI